MRIQPPTAVAGVAPAIKPDPYSPHAALVKPDATKTEVALNPDPRNFFKVYASADEIQYAPEDALKEGLGMVKALKASIKKVDLGSKMRQDVWQEEVKKYVPSRCLGVGWFGVERAMC